MNLTSKINIDSLNSHCKYVGKGTFGKVFIKNLSDYGNVAIKKIVYIDEEDYKYFDNEFGMLKILSEIEGSDIYTPRFYGYYQDKYLTYFIFEALSINLYEYQNRLFQNVLYGKRYLPINNVRCISLQILQGLNFLHNNGIVHCDLKPSNIVFCDNTYDRVKIIDFGLSKKKGVEVDYPVQTSNYRACEVWMEKKYDCPIDIWSFGAILYEMLIGNYMFMGRNDDVILNNIYKRNGRFDQPEMEIISDPWQLQFIGHHNNNKEVINLISSCIEYDVDKRITANNAIFHDFFKIDKIE